MVVKGSQKIRKITRGTRKIARKVTRKAKNAPVKRNKPIRPSNLKHDADLGKLTLRKYVNAKSKAKHDAIKEYEKK